MKRITFEVNDELFKKFKKYCIDENSSMKAKIIELIEKELKSNVSSNQSSNLSSNQPINQSRFIN